MIDTQEVDGKPERITVAWWNTSLAPSGKSRGCDELKRNAVSVIAHLLFTAQADFIALGEISEEDFHHLKSEPTLEDFEFFSGVSKAGRSKFDICYIFKPDKLAIVDFENVTSARGNGVLKVAQRIDLVDKTSGTPFRIFASHWPSRLWCDENHADRHVLGIRLRDAVDAILKDSESPPYIILLGDYNDEPFAKSLSEQLMATRDIDLVHKKNHLFYNPYWGYIGKRGNEISGATGSYFYRGGTNNRWHTFDQIIYSHAFIKAKTWRLAENNSHISEIPGLLDLVISPDSKFDHIPVCGIIERVI